MRRSVYVMLGFLVATLKKEKAIGEINFNNMFHATQYMKFQYVITIKLTNGILFIFLLVEV